MLLGQRNSPEKFTSFSPEKPYLPHCWGGHVSSWLRLLGVCHCRHVLTEIPVQTDLGLHRNAIWMALSPVVRGTSTEDQCLQRLAGFSQWRTAM